MADHNLAEEWTQTLVAMENDDDTIELLSVRVDLYGDDLEEARRYSLSWNTGTRTLLSSLVHRPNCDEGAVNRDPIADVFALVKTVPVKKLFIHAAANALPSPYRS